MRKKTGRKVRRKMYWRTKVARPPSNSRLLSIANRARTREPSRAILPSIQIYSKVMFTTRQQKLLGTLIFLLKVIALSVPLYFIILLNISLSPLQQFDAAVSSGILRIMGYSVQQEGAFITVGSSNSFSFYLTEDCTAWKSLLFLFALIFALPKIPLKKRLIGLGLGVPVLWLGNQARILGVVLTERATSVQFAMFTHDYFWRGFLVLLVLGVWLLWMKPPSTNPKIYLKKKLGIGSGFRMKHSFPKLITRKTKK